MNANKRLMEQQLQQLLGMMDQEQLWQLLEMMEEGRRGGGGERRREVREAASKRVDKTE